MPLSIRRRSSFCFECLHLYRLNVEDRSRLAGDRIAFGKKRRGDAGRGWLLRLGFLSFPKVPFFSLRKVFDSADIYPSKYETGRCVPRFLPSFIDAMETVFAPCSPSL